MKYIGALKPFLPWSGFMESVYADEQDKYYLREIREGKTRYECIDINDIQIIKAKTEIHNITPESPIYSFVFGKEETLIYGAFDDLFAKCIPILTQAYVHSITRQLISSFFKMHGVTASLIKSYKGPSVIHIDVRDSLPDRDLEDFMQVERLMQNVEERMLQHGFTFEDFIYIDEEYLYLGEWRISFERIASFLNLQPASCEQRKIILDLFSHYGIFDEINRSKEFQDRLDKGVSWICEMIYLRGMARAYGNASLEESLNQSLASLSFQVENNIFGFSEEESESDIDLGNFRIMANNVSARMQISY